MQQRSVAALFEASKVSREDKDKVRLDGNSIRHWFLHLDYDPVKECKHGIISPRHPATHARGNRHPVLVCFSERLLFARVDRGQDFADTPVATPFSATRQFESRIRFKAVDSGGRDSSGRRFIWKRHDTQLLRDQPRKSDFLGDSACRAEARTSSVRGSHCVWRNKHAVLGRTEVKITMLHGTTTIAATPPTAYRGPKPPATPSAKARRHSSRSNSFSSASIVTVTRKGSFSSAGTSVRSSGPHMRPHSPGEPSLIALRVGRESASQEHRRRKSVAVEGGELDTQNIGTRWSHATNPSVASYPDSRRSRASSGAALAGALANSTYSASDRSRASVDVSPNASPQWKPGSPRTKLPHRHNSPPPSPERRKRRVSRPDFVNSLTALPPLNTTSASTNPYFPQTGPTTTQTVFTPPASSSHAAGYFSHEPSPQHAVASKQSSVPQSAVMFDAASTDVRSPMQSSPEQHSTQRRTKTTSSNSHTSRPSANTGNRNSHRRQQTRDEHDKDKKGMLSRALQKANTAVLLDNAQNFEGALEAYNDACRLLRQVMERSSALEDIHPEQHSTQRRTKTTSSNSHTSRPSANTGNRNSHRRQQTRDEHDKDKKGMLSRALQKANTAVLLDNAQNFEGALEAYNDACRLLRQVMERSSALEDIQKLEAIRVTYTNRIEELQESESNQPSTTIDKDLPARPMSNDSLENASVAATQHLEQSRGSSIAEQPVQGTDPSSLSSPQVGEPYRADVDPGVALGTAKSQLASQPGFETLTPPVSLGSSAKSEAPDATPTQGMPPVTSRVPYLSPVDANSYMPAPLTPRKQTSTEELASIEQQPVQKKPELSELEPIQATLHRRTSTTSTSWLGTVDESGSSSPSSVHSKSSKTGLRRKHLRNTSGDTDPDFDAAFDAAVEAAYDEGLEPDLEARRKRESALAHGQSHAFNTTNRNVLNTLSPVNEVFPNTSEIERDHAEEERILDEITAEYAQGFNFDLSNKSAVPRQSDSSGYSRSTWQSSQASMDRTTAATSLSTVAEDGLFARFAEDVVGTPSSVNTLRLEPPMHLPPAPPPPSIDLPQLPEPGSARLSTVRSRRLSGQNTKQLKIQTSTSQTEFSRKRASTFDQSPSPRHNTFETHTQDGNASKIAASNGPKTSDGMRSLRSPPSIQLRSAISDTGLPTLAREGVWRRSLDEMGDQPPTSAKPVLVRKNKSSMSLRAEHMVLLASPDVDITPNVLTPMSSTFMTFASKRHHDPLHSQRARQPLLDAGVADGTVPDGIYLFDTSLSSPQSPSSPKSQGMVPSPLEPCPESFLLRPFWLMRALTSTLTHPRGGYVTKRLFVPREVWQTKNVKLKSVEDKVANCDLLTAALGRLASVDTFDADAVMVELQSFEEVMERVQISLAKKLGGEVGVHGISGTFKDAPTSVAPSSGTNYSSEVTSGPEKTKSKENKGSYLSSWRKLRSKSSGAPLNSGSGIQRTVEKELSGMPSVPMTSFVPVERRGHRRDVRHLTFDGPNKDYMGSLARLFDGAQVLDHIARQVEDPGLKHSSPTHVGLELSIRHAAEFFGFYICRFVLADLSTLMDKHVKRGTEWVLAQ
nr:hypothetical protein CFP56_73013 [Quercus suber]